MATQLMLVNAAFMPVDAVLNGSYFMVRAGGKTLITMLTDCGMLWLIQGLTAFLLSRFTDVPVLVLYTAVQAGLIIKAMVSLWFVRQGAWANSVVAE